MDDNRATADFGRGVVVVVTCAKAVVVYDVLTTVGVLLPPDLYSEPIDVEWVGRDDLGVDCREQEPVLALAVNGAGAPVFSPCSSDYQPIVGVRVEVEVGNLELELGLPCRDSSSSLVFGNEAKVGPARERWIGYVGSLGRVDPSTAGDEPTFGVVDDDELKCRRDAG